MSNKIKRGHNWGHDTKLNEIKMFIINIIRLYIESCSGHLKSNTYTHFKFSTFLKWDVFGTQVPKILSICFACSVK